jgi:signal peptidase I
MTEEGERPGFIETWTSAMFRPKALYSRPAGERSLFGPGSFAMIIGAIAGVGAALVEMMLSARPASSVIGSVVGGLVGGPLVAVISVYISAVFTHFWVVVARIKPRSFKDTLECVGYSYATVLFAVIPLVGGLIGGVWQMVVLGIGLKNAQRTTTGRAAFVVLIGPGASVLLALVVRGGFMEAFKMPSGSMIPSLVIGDHLFINKLAYGPLLPGSDTRLFSRLPPGRSDVMVFKFPENKEQDFIKRAIALPGDTLEAINGRPVLDGWLVPHCHVGLFRYENRSAELYVEFLGDRSYLTLFDNDPDEETCKATDECGAGLACRGGICGTLQGPFKVAPNETWVMGDNRNNSHDSRSWRGGLGAGVPFENIKGRATFVWMSFGPGGEIAKDRLFVEIHGRPVLPGGQDAALGVALEKCLRERPPVAQTTPPSPGSH